MKRSGRATDRVRRRVLGAIVVWLCVGAAPAQQPFGHENDYNELEDFARSGPSERTSGARDYVQVHRRSERDWGLDGEHLQRLRRSLDEVRRLAFRFTCDEHLSLARYAHDGRVTREKQRHLAYFLVPSRTEGWLTEERRKFSRDGSIRPGAQASFRDDARFPPPYAWLLLFDPALAPFFGFRLVEERLEGFEVVQEIQFRGAMPFTDGRDIRQWKGTLRIDAARGLPLSLIAEPSSQEQRIQEVHRRYVQALKFSFFGLLNFSTRPRPIGFRVQVEFDHEHAGLRFPTLSRLDFFQVVSTEHVVPVRASVRRYDEYRFTEVDTEERLGAAGDD